MSTPRKHETNFHTSHSEQCWCYKKKRAPAVGVAAPLEPITAEEANQLELLINEIGDAYSIGATSHYSLLDDAPGEGSLADGILRAFNLGRAAVSKNLARIIDPIFDEEARRDWTLKEKLESLVRRDKLMTDRVEELEQSEIELEKEIAKLKLTLELAELHIAELEKNRG